MFAAIKTRWNEARAVELRKETEDVIMRLNSLDGGVNIHAFTSISDTYHFLKSRYGDFENISSTGKKDLAKMLHKKAKQKFTFNMGQGHGLFLMSSYFESQTLPGEDARYTETLITNLIETAIHATNEIDKN